jgi:hypothetical protein
MFAGMLSALSDSFDTLGDDELAPIEVALSEFIASSLVSHEVHETLSMNVSQAATLRRVFNTSKTILVTLISHSYRLRAMNEYQSDLCKNYSRQMGRLFLVICVSVALKSVALIWQIAFMAICPSRISVFAGASMMQRISAMLFEINSTYLRANIGSMQMRQLNKVFIAPSGVVGHLATVKPRPTTTHKWMVLKRWIPSRR